ncbi:hypothetical protein AAT19DRAFT_13542 [Rhodotorula toruloides]|uniref:Uncharacterized protein n=1 Tax=Rhodotorula toruloides TaxID=5286 RepID=A0A2T0ABX8_RHOTO|nr:hypothetical protein AAT19DRAFT_13542 [Rhodotorula toruloides]
MVGLPGEQLSRPRLAVEAAVRTLRGLMMGFAVWGTVSVASLEPELPGLADGEKPPPLAC